MNYRLRHLIPATGVSALCLVAAHSALAQQALDISAGAASTAASTPDGDVTLQATSASAAVTLVGGVPQTVALGTLDVTYDAASFPVGDYNTFVFSFTRALTVDTGGASYTFSEPLSGGGYAVRDGSSGQYAESGLSLDGATVDYDLGASYTLQAVFQPSHSFNDGLEDTPASLSAELTLLPAPEPSQCVALGLGALGLAGTALRAQRRRTA